MIEVSGKNLKEIKRNALREALRQTKGNRSYAADLLGVSIRTVRNMLHENPDLIEEFPPCWNPPTKRVAPQGFAVRYPD
tara:strand:+ start:10342 stop:10578 length:237 start_codon:yes stop_codon:yes gene_type:complete